MNLAPAAKALALARIAIGAGIWAAPRQAMAILGFDACNPQTMAVGRLAGTRDIALGGAALATASDTAAARSMLRVNAAVDAGDALTFAIPLARREGIDRAAVLGVVSAAAASATGFWLAARGE